MADLLLDVSDLVVSYGPIQAVKGVSFQVHEGELVTIIGSNGAGKTSTLNAITGLVPIASGSARYLGQPLSATPVERKASLGIGVSPEGRRVFADLSVEENLMTGGTILSRADCERQIDAMCARFPILGERRTQEAGTLSGGEQQMLAIARALMISPRLLILDEPSLGLAPKIVAQVFDLIAELNDEGVAILLVEQNVRKSLAVADRAYVMELGNITRQGPADELAADSKILDAYLGTS